MSAAAPPLPTLIPHCPRCNYNLTGLSEPRCPECGRTFTAAEWANPALLVREPALERPGTRWLLGVLATLCAFPLRPRRFLRGLVRGEGIYRVVAFAVVLVPLAVLAAIAVCIAAAHLAAVYWQPIRLGPLETWVWGHAEKYRVVQGVVAPVLRCGALIGTSVAVWLPALIVLDLLYWRRRREFRLLAKALLYPLAVWFWASVLACTLGNWVAWRADINAVWGTLGGGYVYGNWPWVCWLAALLTTAQLAAALYVLYSPRCVFVRDPALVRSRWTGAVLVCGWLLALYLLLIDRFVHLRFHLLFVIERFRWLFDYLRESLTS
jgi:hypothetical protein